MDNNVLQKGKNKIRIEVHNSLANRLVGDNLQPESKRHIWMYTQLYNKNSRIISSDIIGNAELVER